MFATKNYQLEQKEQINWGRAIVKGLMPAEHKTTEQRLRAQDRHALHFHPKDQERAMRAEWNGLSVASQRATDIIKTVLTSPKYILKPFVDYKRSDHYVNVRLLFLHTSFYFGDYSRPGLFVQFEVANKQSGVLRV
jgi:hypothetical protein